MRAFKFPESIDSVRSGGAERDSRCAVTLRGRFFWHLGTVSFALPCLETRPGGRDSCGGAEAGYVELESQGSGIGGGYEMVCQV